MSSSTKKPADLKRIRAAITLLGGQVKTAEKLGISQSMVSHWCTGRKRITDAHRAALGLTADKNNE